ncbi:receptor-like protein kinase [Pyrus ussuriensis x Pyrus communis]|uniref:Receptor-like protein kinase n=1 Tax=Pyrus ussuriensis x Pyrus communis TaxID=2448454 RepID=A0A5N5GGV9_9ROSA|nr:receptor-like protein kinase [Pyrus ussuriensis x Pyrus communis]
MSGRSSSSSSSSSSSLSMRFLITAFIVFSLSPQTICNAARQKCTPSSCGHIRNISYPFRLKGDPRHCGNSGYTLSCEKNKTILNIPSSGDYYVQAINYDNKTIRVVDPGLDKSNCSSLPLHSSAPSYWYYQISVRRVYFRVMTTGVNCTPVNCPIDLTFLKCPRPLNSSLYVDAAPCFPVESASTSSSSMSSSQPKSYGYVKIGDLEVGQMKDGCSIERMTYASWFDVYNASYKSVHNSLVYGIEYEYEFASRGHSNVGFFGHLWELIQGYLLFVLFCFGLLFGVKFLFGAPFVTAFFIYTWKRRHLSMYNSIEEFLHGEKTLVPIRYSYSNIKKMSNKFKEKLGEGGYGSVFKARLRSGRFGAIKLLDKPKGNGQDFISEVNTIGRIHHVNVVQLVGYCVEGTKRALVYDFMLNGSLDKYIYCKEGSIPLSCKTTYEIVLGVARGIKYLHDGCDMQILHFDIKPHNILLDENFVPKISDFGLAKLYPVDNSIVSLTAARGTMGYMAPELFYKNIGGVSFKADVYSFGMLLMEMASRRKNLNALAEHSSQLYFPSWVYNQYNEGKDFEVGEVVEEEKPLIRKMIITALWCIQLKPSDRPSMKEVLQMLEGDVELLRMPPEPLLYPQEMPLGAPNDNLNPAYSKVELTSSLTGR